MSIAAGAKITAADFQNLTRRTHNPNDGGTTTSTTFTATLTGGTSPVGVAFTAPPSGKVLVFWYTRERNSGANITLCSIRVGTGSTLNGGSAFVSAADGISIQGSGTADLGASGYYPVEGLTAGNDYNVVLMHRVNTGTGTYGNRHITVEPSIA